MLLIPWIVVGLAGAGAGTDGEEPEVPAPVPGLALEPAVQADSPGPAPAGRAGHGSIELRLGYYDHDDGAGAGNPFLDEDLTVIEPVLVFDYGLTERLGLTGKVTYDNVSSASIDRLSQYPQQSGASGDQYYGVDLGLRYDTTDDVTIGGHAGGSIEYDYRSLALGASVDVAVDSNASYGLSLDGYYDMLDVIRYNGVEERTADRLSIAATGTWYQAMTPEMHGDFGVTLGYQSGFLETPYNGVFFGNPMMETTEELPGSRIRGALWGRVRRRVRPGTAIELGGRVYGDSWDVFGAAIEPRLYQQLTERWRTRLRYRYYHQTEAKDFVDGVLSDPNAPMNNDFRTQDSDLASFGSHTLGLKLIYEPSAAHTFDVGVDYVLRSDDLDQLYGSIGWTWSF